MRIVPTSSQPLPREGANKVVFDGSGGPVPAAGGYSQLRSMASSGREEQDDGELPQIQAPAPEEALVGRRHGNGANPEGLPPELVRQQEAKIQNVWLDYWVRSEVVRQYERDWFSYPDLAQLTMRYKMDHDPVAFMYGLITSKGFPKLAWKYVTSPVMISLLKDAISVASPEATQRSAAIASQDSSLGKFITGIDSMVRTNADPPGYSPIEQAIPKPPPQAQRRLDIGERFQNTRP